MDPIEIVGWKEVILRLGSATLAGAVLGLNRELRGKPAGLRTLALVALGSALFTLAGIGAVLETGKPINSDAISRVIQGIVTGIGFLGAGVIIHDVQQHVRGLTTAATIWLSSSLGIACGLGVWKVVLVGCGLTLVVLALLPALERLLHHRFPPPPEEPSK
jgi:putative Mg2+ transporter-C (MgtC) family protein